MQRSRLHQRLLVCGVLALGVASTSLQLHGQEPAIDTTSLANGPYAELCMLLERTIFKVDVLTLRVRFGGETAVRLRELAAGREYSDDLADSIAHQALAARDVWAELTFVRGVSLNRFVSETRKNMRRARDAGVLDSAGYETIATQLPRWYAFLDQRGIREGDAVLYRVRGDTLRSLFRAADGTIMLDQTNVGPERRLAVMGSYFAPGSDFRERLIQSLFKNSTDTCGS